MIGSAFSTIIHVPNDYPTIQQGLNAASTGDTVLVAPGIYFENIFWPLVNGIKLYSELGSDTTKIDGGLTTSVIYFPGMIDIDTMTVIKGFTIQNGYGDPDAGGIYLVNSSPVIKNNIIKYNKTQGRGGGICCSDTSSPLIISNVITVDSANCGGAIYCEEYCQAIIKYNKIENNAATGYLARGGGICCNNYSNAEVIGDTIVGNTTLGEGGGISCGYEANVLIDSNIISNNSANGGGGVDCDRTHYTIISNNTILSNSAYDGGGISISLGGPQVTNNQIIGNSATWTGGGISIAGGSSSMILGNYISNNTAVSVEGGGGIYCSGDGSDTIKNNIIVNNIAYDGGGINCSNYTGSINSAIIGDSISGNIAYRNGGGIFCRASSGPHIKFNTISDNNADSLGDGIYCKDNSFPIVDSNNIYDNGYGAYNADNSQMLMAEYNWWGDPSGPYHPALNPGGLGDSTNILVDPVPWLTTPVGAVQEDEIRHISVQNQIKQNYPNPFCQTTTINYYCFKPARVTIIIYNIVGQNVATLIDRIETVGEHAAIWDARALNPGVYFYQVTINDCRWTRKCLLMK